MTEQGTVTLQTRSGFWFRVRPTRDADEAELAAFFRAVGPEDLRFRFLSTIREVSHERLVEMIAQTPDTDSVVAETEAGELVAAAMLAGDPVTRRGEVAITIRADHKGRGIGWSLLEYLVETARQRGYASIESLEDRQNRSAIALEQEMGFVAEAVEDDATLVRVSRQLT